MPRYSERESPILLRAFYHLLAILFDSKSYFPIFAMSTTTTTPAETLSVLADYEVHHSESQEPTQEQEPVSVTSSQPADWPTDHRRVPAYRPVQSNLSYLERPAGNGHPAEYAFIQIMLHGVWLNASVSRLWRFTGGRINDKIFHYEVGGEW